MGTAWRAVVIVVLVCAVSVVVAWAALIGPQQVFTGPGLDRAVVSTSLTPTPTEGGDPLLDTLRDQAERADPPWWAKALVWAFEALVLLGMLGVAVLATRAAWHAWQSRPERSPGVAMGAFDALSEPSRVRAAIAEDASEQEALLRSGHPRNAVVEAWHRFEVQGARAGVPRRGSETSSEYALRLLDLVEAPPGAVNRLAALYREARFSDHPLDEGHRDAALAALSDIHLGLGATR
ncbi:MAG: DUF4129 domain-containing protein [Nocardioides sp.]|nr:DUF4129 domain-containing protein [Nocardioides sp.]